MKFWLNTKIALVKSMDVCNWIDKKNNFLHYSEGIYKDLMTEKYISSAIVDGIIK